jgi:hypothetical protein
LCVPDPSLPPLRSDTDTTLPFLRPPFLPFPSSAVPIPHHDGRGGQSVHRYCRRSRHENGSGARWATVQVRFLLVPDFFPLPFLPPRSSVTRRSYRLPPTAGPLPSSTSVPSPPSSRLSSSVRRLFLLSCVSGLTLSFLPPQCRRFLRANTWLSTVPCGVFC